MEARSQGGKEARGEGGKGARLSRIEFIEATQRAGRVSGVAR